MNLKPMRNHPDYAATTEGDIYSRKSGEWKKLKPQKDTDGYLQVRLCDIPGKRGRLTFVHRLVAETFIPMPRNCTEVNHIDGDKLNNAASNLEWTTRQGNMLHAHDHGLANTRKPLRATNLETGKQFIFSGQREAARQLGVNQGNISHAMKRDGGSAYGYRFEYMEVN